MKIYKVSMRYAPTEHETGTVTSFGQYRYVYASSVTEAVEKVAPHIPTGDVITGVEDTGMVVEEIIS